MLPHILEMIDILPKHERKSCLLDFLLAANYSPTLLQSAVCSGIAGALVTGFELNAWTILGRR